MAAFPNVKRGDRLVEERRDGRHLVRRIRLGRRRPAEGSDGAVLCDVAQGTTKGRTE